MNVAELSRMAGRAIQFLDLDLDGRIKFANDCAGARTPNDIPVPTRNQFHIGLNLALDAGHEIPGAREALAASAFGKPDQQRDYHGRWGRGGSKSSALTGDEALDHVKERTKTVGYDQYDRKIAIMDYADSGYGAINDGLRRAHGNVSELDGKRPDNVREIDAIFADTPAIEKPIAVYRGMRDYKNIFGVSDGHELVGKTLTDQGFLSTSTERDVASNFASGGALRHRTDRPASGQSKNAVFIIHAPIGTKAVHVGKATNIAKKGEAEILFNRGSSLKITKVTTSSDGLLEVEAEL